jgi:hypothetical protein
MMHVSGVAPSRSSDPGGPVASWPPGADGALQVMQKLAEHGGKVPADLAAR